MVIVVFTLYYCTQKKTHFSAFFSSKTLKRNATTSPATKKNAKNGRTKENVLLTNKWKQSAQEHAKHVRSESYTTTGNKQTFKQTSFHRIASYPPFITITKIFNIVKNTRKILDLSCRLKCENKINSGWTLSWPIRKKERKEGKEKINVFLKKFYIEFIYYYYHYYYLLFFSWSIFLC